MSKTCGPIQKFFEPKGGQGIRKADSISEP